MAANPPAKRKRPPQEATDPQPDLTEVPDAPGVRSHTTKRQRLDDAALLNHAPASKADSRTNEKASEDGPLDQLQQRRLTGNQAGRPAQQHLQRLPETPKPTRRQFKKRSFDAQNPWCKSCQAYHLWGQHTRTLQEARELRNQQALGQVPMSDPTLVREALYGGKRPPAPAPTFRSANGAIQATPQPAEPPHSGQRSNESEILISGMLQSMPFQYQMTYIASIIEGNFGAYAPQPPRQQQQQQVQLTSYASTGQGVPVGTSFSIASTPYAAKKPNNQRGRKSNNQTQRGGGNSNSKAYPRERLNQGERFALTSSGPMRPHSETARELIAPQTGNIAGSQPQIGRNAGQGQAGGNAMPHGQP